MGVRFTGRDHITTTGALSYVFLQLVAGMAGASVAYGISGGIESLNRYCNKSSYICTNAMPNLLGWICIRC